MIYILFFLILIFVYFLHRIRRKKLREYRSAILGHIEIWEKYNGEKVLTINKYPHGISIEDKSITKSYWHFISKRTLEHIESKKRPRVLFFGLGANTSSRIIQQKNSHVSQTIIEIDKYIIQACRDFFHLNEMKKLTVIHGDAYRLVKTLHRFRNIFDVIVVDIFTGIPPYVSTKTNQPPFILSAFKWLKKDGRMIFNRPANIASDREDTKKLLVYLHDYFKKVDSTYIHDPRSYENDVIVATELK